MDYNRHVSRDPDGSWRVVVELAQPLVHRWGFATEAEAKEWLAAQMALLAADDEDLHEVIDDAGRCWLERGDAQG